MKNKKGFTIIELGISITLVTVVAFLLFQMITSIKKIYASSDLKTTLLTKQAIMTKKIYDEFEQKDMVTIGNCGQWQNSCLLFVFSDGTTSTLLVDPLNHTVSYNNYLIDYQELDDTIDFGELTFDTTYADFFTVKIPITSNNIQGDYGISVTKQHDGSITDNHSEVNLQIEIPLMDAAGNETTTTITSDGTDYWMRVYNADDQVLNNAMSTQLKYLKIDTCSDTAHTGVTYELKTGSNVSRWCQKNNFYTQSVDISNYELVDGGPYDPLGKYTYKEALTATSALGTTLDLKVNAFLERYTFKSRKVYE